MRWERDTKDMMIVENLEMLEEMRGILRPISVVDGK